jgi:hypothetical protein
MGSQAQDPKSERVKLMEENARLREQVQQLTRQVESDEVLDGLVAAADFAQEQVERVKKLEAALRRIVIENPPHPHHAPGGHQYEAGCLCRWCTAARELLGQ